MLNMPGPHLVGNEAISQSLSGYNLDPVDLALIFPNEVNQGIRTYRCRGDECPGFLDSVYKPCISHPKPILVSSCPGDARCLGCTFKNATVLLIHIKAWRGVQSRSPLWKVLKACVLLLDSHSKDGYGDAGTRLHPLIPKETFIITEMGS
jgi:hypothetical protein